MAEFDVSYLVTVYNKEPYIANTVKSLLTQEHDLKVEYIFVDDVSSDRSVEIIESITYGMPNVTIVKNVYNTGGPSIPLNKAAKLASGKYLICMDSDDILAANTTSIMYNLLEKHQADVIYGRWKKYDVSGDQLLGNKVPENYRYKVSANPLNFVLNGRFLRMGFMARSDTYKKAGGADERILVQDESLPLRLAINAKGFIALHEIVLLIPSVKNPMSQNASIRNHDRFFANRNVLVDYPNISEVDRRLIFRRCISAAWKQKYLEKRFFAIFGSVFWHYLYSKIILRKVDLDLLRDLSNYFLSIPGVRRREQT